VTEPRAVAFGVLKGGFGKTTTALNTARELARRNDGALVVDLDDNGHMTLNLGFDEEYRGEAWGDESVNHADEVLLGGADPREYIVDVVDGLDLFPAHVDYESVQNALKDATMGTTRLKQNLVDPLLGSDYEYIVLDCPANRGKLNDNGMYASGNIIIPLRPENGYESGLTNTLDRLVKQAREYFELDILAIVPTDLQDRIDQNTRDRALLEELTKREHVRQLVPNFAFLDEDEWADIDRGEYNGPLPGIRHRGSIDSAHEAGLPLRDHDPDCDQLAHYVELAEIVERGEVLR